MSNPEFIDKTMQFLFESRPKTTFEMDNEVFEYIRHLKDDRGSHYWCPTVNNPDKRGTFLGCDLVITEHKCFQIKHEHSDGTSITCTPDFGLE